MKCALVIENDEATAQAVMSELSSHGFSVQWANNGSTGLAMAVTGDHDTITLARLLPDLDGLTIISTLRAQGIQTPVLMISAPADIDERVKGLRAEGDDYLTKPFTSGEMIARLQVLRRRQTYSDAALVSGNLRLDVTSQLLTRNGAEVVILPSEFKLLMFLMRNIGQRVTSTMLFEQAWGYPFDPGNHVIDVHIERLRKKIEGPGSPILQTLRDSGYILLSPQ